MLSRSAREATTRQQKQLNKFSCFLNRKLRYNCSIARSELFTSCGRFRGGFRPSRPHGTNVLGCGASLWIAPSAAPHTSLVGGMTEMTDHWLGRPAMFQHCCEWIFNTPFLGRLLVVMVVLLSFSVLILLRVATAKETTTKQQQQQQPQHNRNNETTMKQQQP